MPPPDIIKACPLPMLLRIPTNARVENDLVFIGDSMFVIGIVSPLNRGFMECATPINIMELIE